MAMVVLEKKLNFADPATMYIRPVCLPTKDILAGYKAIYIY